MCLEPSTVDTDLRRAYAVLKCWYLHASARAPNPSRAEMSKVTKDYATLYQQEDLGPPVRSLITHVEPFQISDEVTTEAEVGAEFRRLRPHKASVHT